MSFKSPVWLLTLVAATLLATDARAQKIQPFIEPDAFGPDFQFFAPADVSTFGGGPEAKRGFFATIDRVYVNVSRPRTVPNDGLAFPQFGEPQNIVGAQGDFGAHEGDWSWGNRFDFGYITADDHGWLFSVTNLNGPNTYLTTTQQSMELVVGGQAGGGAANATAIPADLGIQQSLNAGNMTSLEINKIWRAPPFHNGTVLEPFIGVRYVNFTDIFKHDIYGRFDTDADDFPDFLTPIGIGPGFEVIRTRKAFFENQMLGGQLGFRLNRQHGHWTFSGELRAFAFQNWQFLSIYEEQTAQQFSATGTRGQRLETREKPILVDNSEFVWGGEIRAQVGYSLTRDISINCGFVFMDFGQGIGRGGSMVGNDQDLLIVGTTFGVVYNR